MDHLVFAVPDLAEAIELLERQTGVRPRFGGRHPGRGTHNALLSLGGRQYLEIIALDATQGAAADALMFPDLIGLSQPRFIAWAVAVASVAEFAQRAKALGIDCVGPLAGARTEADGLRLSWKTLRPRGPGSAGLPFFIEWGEAVAHPAETSPRGCVLSSFAIEHPAPDTLRRLLAGLGLDAVVSPGASVRLSARLATPLGAVEFA